MILKAIFMQYLLLPLIAVLLTGLMVLVKKKNKLIQNKKLIIYILVASLVLALPGAGGIGGNTFVPYGYLLVQIVYLLLGMWHRNLLAYYFKEVSATREESKGKEKTAAILFELLVSIISMTVGGYLFTLLFNWLCPYRGYAFTAATSMLVFIVPLLFQYAYESFIEIPFAIYKVWQFVPGHSDDNSNNYTGKLLLINLELTKTINDRQLMALKAKAPADILLGEWMNRVLDDHDRKNADPKIDTISDTGEAYGWVFYVKPSFFHRRRYLDFEKNMMNNNVREKHTVICKRVIRGEEEKTVAIASRDMN